MLLTVVRRMTINSSGHEVGSQVWRVESINPLFIRPLTVLLQRASQPERRTDRSDTHKHQTTLSVIADSLGTLQGNTNRLYAEREARPCTRKEKARGCDRILHSVSDSLFFCEYFK